jgi:hypothetical protein
MNFEDFFNIIKKHGFHNGLKRIRDEFFENYLFDLINKTSTREIVVKKNYGKFFNNNNNDNKKIKNFNTWGGGRAETNGISQLMPLP